MSAIFGPAGFSDSFYAAGLKGSLELPEFLMKNSLNAYEYQCGRGVNVSEEKAFAFGNVARENGITVSLHAPYYISMSSVDEEKRMKSADYILASARAVKNMGGNRIVVHTGSCGKISREEALALAKSTMKYSLGVLDAEGLGDVHICPETMGKINQLGTLYEVIELCKIDERLIPCIDFGHLNARTLGGVSEKHDFEDIFDNIANALGEYRAKNFHSHFSKIQYTDGGEKCHLTFADNIFGPDYEPFIETVFEKNCNLTVICESAGTQTEDAAAMKTYYEKLKQTGE